MSIWVIMVESSWSLAKCYSEPSAYVPLILRCGLCLDCYSHRKSS